MNTVTLELFLDVMRLRSFTAVAHARQVAPSSVSRAIQQLEQELNSTLFQRNARGLEPTEAAEVFYRGVSPAMEELSAAQEAVTRAQLTPRGRLRIAAPTVYGQERIVPLLPILYAQYPELSVELYLQDAFVDLIGERIDVAIRLGALKDSSYIARKLHPMRFVVCASPAFLQRSGRPVNPGDLSKMACLLMPRQGQYGLWHFHQNGKTQGVEVQGRCLVTNSGAVRDCALAGMGVALLPDWLVQKHLTSGELEPLFEPFDVTPNQGDNAIWLLRPNRKYLPAKVKVFQDLLGADNAHQTR